MKQDRRKVDIVVISDIHLGTYGCHANELYEYLKSIKPGILILNGDIIDFWQFSKNYFPSAHLKVLKEFIRMASKGTKIYYITGNHDETLRKFSGLKLGNIEISNKLELELNGVRIWFFHGDVFDVIMQHSRWLEKLGSKSYDMLILLNSFVNFLIRLFGRKRISISRRIKDNVKLAVKYISNFESTASLLAAEKGFRAIVCGHIHKPEIRDIETEKGTVMYLNSGDWIENLSALEYNKGKWSLFWSASRDSVGSPFDKDDTDDHIVEMDNKEVFRLVMKEFRI